MRLFRRGAKRQAPSQIAQGWKRCFASDTPRAPGSNERPAAIRETFWREAGTLKKYSVFAIAREAMRGHKGWEEQWSSPEPKKEYDVIIVGAGGHGLATAYYLATVHGITNVAVLEKGW